MKTTYLMLAAIAAAVAVTAGAAAGTDARTQRVAITMKRLPSGAWVLRPLRPGAVEEDSGTVRATVANYTPRVVVRNGQRVEVFKPVVWLLEGRRGTLTIREPANEWMETGNADIGIGRWSVVRGTGQYEGAVGGGRSAHVGHNHGTGPWFARQEGFLVVP